MKKLNLKYTPEMIEDLKNAKGFDYEKHDAEIDELMEKKNIQISGGEKMRFESSKTILMIPPEKRKKDIEDLAWVIFQEKLNISFKSSLTEEKKRKITDVPEYQEYIDYATEIYNKRIIKKEKSLHNKKYRVIDVPSSGKSTWMGGAYVLCFVYSKYDGNFVLRGYMKEVKEYLKKNYNHYFYNLSMWNKGQSRNHWFFWKDNVGIFDSDKNDKITVRQYTESNWGNPFTSEPINKPKPEFKFKRLPKRWIPEFDVFK